MKTPRPRCGKWMPNAKQSCGQPENHGGKCRTARATKAYIARTSRNTRTKVAARQALINEYKMEKGCINCGYADNPVALDLDHRDPEHKTGNISNLLRYSSWAVVLAELEKCQVLCANCHRVKTVLDQDFRRRRPAASAADDGPHD